MVVDAAPLGLEHHLPRGPCPVRIGVERGKGRSAGSRHGNFCGKKVWECVKVGCCVNGIALNFPCGGDLLGIFRG